MHPVPYISLKSTDDLVGALVLFMFILLISTAIAAFLIILDKKLKSKEDDKS